MIRKLSLLPSKEDRNSVSSPRGSNSNVNLSSNTSHTFSPVGSPMSAYNLNSPSIPMPRIRKLNGESLLGGVHLTPEHLWPSPSLPQHASALSGSKQSKYNNIGLFPNVRLQKTPLPILSSRSVLSSPVTVKIAPPDLLRRNSSNFHAQNGDQSASASKESTPGPCDTETVLTAIREKRKRGLYADDHSSVTGSDVTKRRRNESINSLTESQGSSVHEMSVTAGDARRDEDGGDREVGKRRRATDEEHGDVLEADAKKTRYESRRICRGARNEYEASMSSSVRLSLREVASRNNSRLANQSQRSEQPILNGNALRSRSTSRENSPWPQRSRRNSITQPDARQTSSRATSGRSTPVVDGGQTAVSSDAETNSRASTPHRLVSDVLSRSRNSAMSHIFRKIPVQSYAMTVDDLDRDRRADLARVDDMIRDVDTQPTPVTSSGGLFDSRAASLTLASSSTAAATNSTASVAVTTTSVAAVALPNGLVSQLASSSVTLTNVSVTQSSSAPTSTTASATPAPPAYSTLSLASTQSLTTAPTISLASPLGLKPASLNNGLTPTLGSSSVAPAGSAVSSTGTVPVSSPRSTLTTSLSTTQPVQEQKPSSGFQFGFGGLNGISSAPASQPSLAAALSVQAPASVSTSLPTTTAATALPAATAGLGQGMFNFGNLDAGPPKNVTIGLAIGSSQEASGALAPVTTATPLPGFTMQAGLSFKPAGSSLAAAAAAFGGQASVPASSAAQPVNGQLAKPSSLGMPAFGGFGSIGSGVTTTTAANQGLSFASPASSALSTSNVAPAGLSGGAFAPVVSKAAPATNQPIIGGFAFGNKSVGFEATSTAAQQNTSTAALQQPSLAVGGFAFGNNSQSAQSQQSTFPSAPTSTTFGFGGAALGTIPASSASSGGFGAFGRSTGEKTTLPAFGAHYSDPKSPQPVDFSAFTSQAQKPLAAPSFAFGQAASSAASTSKPSMTLGSAAPAAGQTLGMFGQPNQAAATAAFGQAASSAAGTPAFGQLSQFGQTSAFGQSQTQQAAATPFGQLQTQQTAATPFGQAGPFGQSLQQAPVTAAQPQQSTGLFGGGAFGQTAATQAQGSVFGQPFGSSQSTTTSMFGGQQPAKAFGQSTGTGVFGQPQQPAANTGIFGQPQAASSSLTPFGQAPAGSGPSAAPAAGGFAFGQQAAASTPTNPAFQFGQAPTQAPSTFNFGAAGPSPSPAFGAPPAAVGSFNMGQSRTATSRPRAVAARRKH